MNKDKIYLKYHRKLAKIFGVKPKSIQYVRAGFGRGLSLSEIKKLHEEKISTRQESISHILRSIEIDKEVIDLIDNLSRESMDELLHSEPDELKSSNEG